MHRQNKSLDDTGAETSLIYLTTEMSLIQGLRSGGQLVSSGPLEVFNNLGGVPLDLFWYF